jgi:hypothetical protein
VPAERGPIRLGVGFVSDDRLCQEATALLVRHGRLGIIPVDVEMLVEKDMGLEIIPVPGLRDLAGETGTGTESFTDTRAIYVDQRIMERVPVRYRFSLAHEVGHIVLHGSILDAHRFGSVAEWKDFMCRVHLDDHFRMEYQASAFAGHLLVPTGHLARLVRQGIPSVESMVNEARALGFDRSQYLPNALAVLTDQMRGAFDVSADVLRRRIGKEGLDQLVP